MPAIATSSSRDASGARPPRTPAIDTIRLVETPEGCQLTLRIAGPLARARAWLVDLAIRMFLYMAGASALSTFGSMGTGLILILVFLLEWAYPVVFEIWRDGQTPGKRMCHLAVVHADGTPVGTSAAIVRNIVRAVDFLPVGYVVGLITMLCAGSGRRLGDLAAGTVVVHTDGARVLTPRTWTDGAADHLPLPLSAAERRAVVDFATRLPRLSPARAEELARTATPLVDGVGEGEAAARLVRLANTIAGRATDT
ncbi:RDD family protein [Luteitalea sp.]|uniref:RDD family protein n=1 Tax=Luteitalea sp. TaxID=2004800 RepID=UPI0025BB2C23|nr:RDD family protein [Luteitalea sp.]